MEDFITFNCLPKNYFLSIIIKIIPYKLKIKLVFTIKIFFFKIFLQTNIVIIHVHIKTNYVVEY